jgi:hypothetical protein
MNKIKIKVGQTELTADLIDTELAEKIAEILPLTSSVSRWGDEIYFEIPLSYDIRNSTTDVDIGDLAYWPQGRCFCIFYGLTPASIGDKPIPASEVEVFGKIQGDAKALKYEKSPEISVDQL